MRAGLRTSFGEPSPIHKGNGLKTLTPKETKQQQRRRNIREQNKLCSLCLPVETPGVMCGGGVAYWVVHVVAVAVAGGGCLCFCSIFEKKN